ncbi:hypothetical protein L484_026237 [Morus notabilis]|uniref:Uncharacterized protein n=1 Tax=Morus notabilis TaxID=981085 RepID=W9RGX6_9ROSA|nr:hypothetical protein L484_026237 [Morus notabilis]
MGGFAILRGVASAACVAWELSPAAGNNGVVAFLRRIVLPDLFPETPIARRRSPLLSPDLSDSEAILQKSTATNHSRREKKKKETWGGKKEKAYQLTVG